MYVKHTWYQQRYIVVSVVLVFWLLRFVSGLVTYQVYIMECFWVRCVPCLLGCVSADIAGPWDTHDLLFIFLIHRRSVFAPWSLRTPLLLKRLSCSARLPMAALFPARAVCVAFSFVAFLFLSYVSTGTYVVSVVSAAVFHHEQQWCLRCMWRCFRVYSCFAECVDGFCYIIPPCLVLLAVSTVVYGALSAMIPGTPCIVFVGLLAVISDVPVVFRVWVRYFYCFLVVIHYSFITLFFFSCVCMLYQYRTTVVDAQTGCVLFCCMYISQE